jgi:phosphatidylglycerol:prolipoprotein diacylglycerol transferase
MYPLLFKLGPLSIYSYGVLLATAYIVGLQLALRRADRAGLSGQRVMDLGIFIIISALVGAKLMLFIVEFKQFTSEPARLMVLLKSGGVFYGGLLLGLPVAWWYIQRHKLPLWTTCDLFAPGLALGHSIGRMGCLLAGCCYGLATDVPWAITFTSSLAATNVGTPLGIALHPTQVYEAVAELAIFGFLLVGERRWRHFAGRTFWTYLLLYPISRIIIEFYRGDPRGMVIGSVSTSQFLSALLVPLAIAMLILLSRRGTSVGASAKRSSNKRRSESRK